MSIPEDRWPLESTVGEHTAILIETLADCVDAAICLVDAENRVRWANPTWLRDHETSRTDAGGKPVDGLGADPEGSLQRSLERARAGEKVCETFPLRHGAIRQRRIASVPLPEGMGLLLVERDLADDATAYLDALVDNAPFGIGFWDKELRFQRLNPRLAEINGLPIEAHLGKRPTELFSNIDDLVEIERIWRRILETGEPIVGFEVAGETPAQPGVRRVWSETWYPVRRGDEVVGIGALVREVTHEKQAQAFYDVLLGVVGHDLRSPLAAILTDVEVLSRLLSGDDDGPRKAVERIRRSGKRISEIIELLLDFTQARGTGIPLHPVASNVGVICKSVVAEHRTNHPNRDIHCEGDGDGRVVWDVRRISQAISNLIDNALKYGDPSKPVQLRWRASDTIVVEVENDGPPIPESQRPSLFEPFNRGRGKPTRSLGLGLFIAHEITHAHGGVVTAESEDGTTIFRMDLPRTVASAT